MLSTGLVPFCCYCVRLVERAVVITLDSRWLPLSLSAAMLGQISRVVTGRAFGINAQRYHCMDHYLPPIGISPTGPFRSC